MALTGPRSANKTAMPLRIWNTCTPWLVASQAGTLHESPRVSCKGVAGASDGVEDVGVRQKMRPLKTYRMVQEAQGVCMDR
jgi:hypothetical protein